MPITIKTPGEVLHLQHAGRLLFQAISEATESATHGTRSVHLAKRAEQELASRKLVSVLPQQRNGNGAFFDCKVSVNINEETTHTPPSERILRAGDVVTLDVAARLDGGSGPESMLTLDCAISRAVGTPTSERARALVAAANEVSRAVLAEIRPNRPAIHAINAAHRVAKAIGYALAPVAIGHGVGATLHESPEIPLVPTESIGSLVWRTGMVFTIEPVVVEKAYAADLAVLDDGWTTVTKDRRWTAFEERTVAVGRSGVVVLAGDSA